VRGLGRQSFHAHWRVRGLATYFTPRVQSVHSLFYLSQFPPYSLIFTRSHLSHFQISVDLLRHAVQRITRRNVTRAEARAAPEGDFFFFSQFITRSHLSHFQISVDLLRHAVQRITRRNVTRAEARAAPEGD
jgi:hypothetical protein